MEQIQCFNGLVKLAIIMPSKHENLRWLIINCAGAMKGNCALNVIGVLTSVEPHEIIELCGRHGVSRRLRFALCLRVCGKSCAHLFAQVLDRGDRTAAQLELFPTARGD